MALSKVGLIPARSRPGAISTFVNWNVRWMLGAQTHTAASSDSIQSLRSSDTPNRHLVRHLCSQSPDGNASKLGNVVKLAKDGFGHGSANYDTHRPSYTDSAIDVAVKAITVDPPSRRHSTELNVLELGAGTGKLTQGLAPRLPAGTKYLATDPSRDFLNFLESKKLPVSTKISSASRIDLKDSSAENIVCAQCFHWFSNDETLQEMHRVLVPDGKLILMWNANKFDEGWPTEVSKQRYEVMARVGASTANWFNTMKWQDAIDASPLFSLQQHRSLAGVEYKCTIGKVLENARTISSYNALPELEREEYLDKLKQAILVWPGVDPDDMIMPFTSEIYVYKRK